MISPIHTVERKILSTALDYLDEFPSPPFLKEAFFRNPLSVESRGYYQHQIVTFARGAELGGGMTPPPPPFRSFMGICVREFGWRSACISFLACRRSSFLFLLFRYAIRWWTIPLMASSDLICPLFCQQKCSFFFFLVF